MKEFSSQVTDVTLARAKLFIEGQQDRRAGLPARQNDGAYLNGWYGPEKPVPPMFSDEDWEVAQRLPEFVELLGESRLVESLVEKLLEGDAQQDAILAVSFDISKTIIWVVSDVKVRKALEMLVAGKDWNDDVLDILGNSTCASNSTDRKAQKEAERLEMEADYWIDITDPSTWREALA